MKQICLRRPLSRRLNQVLQLLGDGLNGEQIAKRLGIGVGTVWTYFGHLKNRLGVSNLQDARRLARKWEIGELRIFVPIERERV